MLSNQILVTWHFILKFLAHGIFKWNTWYLVLSNENDAKDPDCVAGQGQLSLTRLPTEGCRFLIELHSPNTAQRAYPIPLWRMYPILIQYQNTQLMVCNTHCAYPIPQQCIAAVLTYHIFGTKKRCITTLMKKILKKYHNNFSTLIWSRATSSIAVTTAITGRLSSRRYCLWANNSPITTSDTQVTWMLTTALNFSLQSRMVVAVAEDFYWTQARSLPCLVSQWVTARFEFC